MASHRAAADGLAIVGAAFVVLQPRLVMREEDRRDQVAGLRTCALAKMLLRCCRTVCTELTSCPATSSVAAPCSMAHAPLRCDLDFEATFPLIQRHELRS
jgi:hypothetical protein